MKLNDPTLFRQRCLINGEWVGDGAQFDQIYNPADNSVVGFVPRLGSEETQASINAAERAQKGWKAQTAKTRSQILRRWYELMFEHQDDLAAILTTEQGKPFAEAKGEIAYAASFIEWFAEEAKRTYGETIPSHKADARIVVTKEPIGVVGAITPWNFPAAMITRKCGPALAAGCAVVLKPAPETPFTALALGELAIRAGIPAGVLNIVTGDAIQIGGALTQSPIVRKISFTGSTHVGKILMNQSSDTVKKLSLELGGNAPFIVFDDADLDSAVQGLMVAKYRNAGQTCVCANRIFVHRMVHDVFIAKFKTAVEALQVGDGFRADVQIGAMINQAAVTKVCEHVQNALEQGATLVSGNPNPPKDLFLNPLIVTDMNDDMHAANEETFGPLAAIFPFDSEQEVIERANDSDSGLAAYFYTQSLARAWRVGEALEAGMVGINEGLISTEVAPFGGIKSSGLGREGARQGIEDYLETKYMLMGGL
ncbi:NAD-dependent succinate-semialdehyde dehydrogenase [Vibrio nigripulchritudo]|uniref:NAD-dependent succinate-semialdehyde dehydrogenase n=1 Tax=Vibrio nigripulchritudo TaxID=28173 RepID=UPI00190D67B1|nr:NAD-dependent succinate-semialdehyde dehydrogenase [Vibrio nigripulchritudo]BCL73474.1 NAD-dependent succinate-semialdehyde dehydrogenase [Vibrio nigripulchritudo]BDU34841.1 NAD-dependent succinate-semialdehyde dehydrogenase [Vibrio nigripulchritudo]